MLFLVAVQIWGPKNFESLKKIATFVRLCVCVYARAFFDNN